MTQQEIQEKYKQFFPKRKGKPDYPSELFGIETHDGWNKLLEEIFEYISVTLGLRGDQFTIVQIKEKFGGLRFYFQTTGVLECVYNELANYIAKKEAESLTICEDCGRPGKLRRDLGWMLTLCDQHYKEHLSFKLGVAK